MNKELLFAADLEKNILAEVEKVVQSVSPAIRPAVHMLFLAEQGWNDLFTKKLGKNGDQYPLPDAETLLGCDKDWQKIIESLKEAVPEGTGSLTLFWMLYALVERTVQYYQQAAANSAYPAERLFFTSLAQYKILMKKRVGSLVRIMYNHAWAELGFAPFLLGKE